MPDKEAFYSSLNLEDIVDADHRHASNAVKKFKLKNLEYHDLYVQSDTLLLADMFESFRNKYIEIYNLDPAYFLSAPVLAWETCLKETEGELEMTINVDMLLMIEK